MSSKEEMLRRVLLRESLRKQHEEFELLKSIYSMPGEFRTDNSLLVDEIQEFLRGNRASVEEKLDFRIKIQLTEKIKMELSVILGQLYPTHDLPMFTIRTDTLSKIQEKLVKQAIESYIETDVDKNEPYIYQVVNWLQDNVEEIVKTKSLSQETKEVETMTNTKERVWIYSHHIYSKIKRQNIVKLCRGSNLNGFMWPGKPGVICIEGQSKPVQDVTRTIKSWQWQKLKIIKVETSDDDEEEFNRFTGFEEILTSDGDDGEDVKMDTGMFFKYLDAHRSSSMRKEIFGFD